MRHYIKPAHLYDNTIRDLVSCIGEQEVATFKEADVVWLPFRFSYADHFTYPKHLKLVYVWHGGDSRQLSEKSLQAGHYLDNLATLNIVVKKRGECAALRAMHPEINSLCILGKYHSAYEQFASIRSRRSGKTLFSYPFVLLNNNFSNHAWGVHRYNALDSRFKEMLHIFGEFSPNGARDDCKILLETKFSLMLKQGGYVCNFVVRSILSGVPVVMLRELYYREYAEHFPENLFVLAKTFESGMRDALSLSNLEYCALTARIAAFSEAYFARYNASEMEDARNFVQRIAVQQVRGRGLGNFTDKNVPQSEREAS